MDIHALGVAWQRETFTLTDETGQALRPAILWLDVRSHAETAALAAQAQHLHRLTGVPPDITTIVPRLRWLRRHEPELFRGARRWEDVGSYLLGRLTGRRATCWSGADTSGLVSLETPGWCREVADLAGLGPEDLPELVGPGEVVGGLLPGAAEEAGLPPGLPVVAAGGDGQVFAACALMQGQGLALSLGTSVVLGIPTMSHPISPLFRTLRSSWPGQGRLLEAVLQSGTYLFRWLVDRLSPGRSSLEELEGAASSIPAGSEGLVTVPHWWGARFPSPSPDARGAVLGFTDTHTGAHLYRSLVEGSTFEIRYLAERIAEVAPGAGGTVTVGGGGASSALWLSVLSDVLNRPVRLAMEEPVAAGAALLGALGAGHTEAQAAFAAPEASQPARLPSVGRGVYDRIYDEVWLPYRAASVELSARVGRLARGGP